MSGLRRLSDTALSGGGAAAAAGQVPVFNSTTGHFAPGAPKYDAKTSAYNVSDTSLRRWKAQLSKALTGTSVASIVCLGDSITEGVTSSPHRLWNWPYRLRLALAADGRCGTVGEGAAFNTAIQSTGAKTLYDERWVLGTNWSWVGGGLLNSSALQCTTPGSPAATFALPSCDTVTIYYLHNGASWSTFNVNLDGGTNTPITPATTGGIGIASTTITAGSVGPHTLNMIPPAASGFVTIMGVRWATSTAPNDVEVFTGGGQSGQTSDRLLDVSGGFGNLSMIDIFKPDLTIVCMGRNDAAFANPDAAPTAGTNFAANIQTLIQRCRTTNGTDVLLLAPPPSIPANYPGEAIMRADLYSLCDSLDVAMIDLSNRFGPNWNLAPYNISTDNIHPNDAGQQAIAQTVANVLLNV